MESTIMEYRGFNAKIMEAPRLTGEQVHGLPPGSPLKVYPVDAFVKPPENWMRGPGVFVVPVRPNKGLWFDWTDNSQINTAVIPTVKGCNPITGMPTSGFHLEKYENKCPKHGCDFMAERFCPECNYKWPDRNFQSMSPSWWDGFRSDDGHVRQFFFSEDELRDVASSLIGKENTVPAFGFAFYSPKQPRVEPQQTMRDFGTGVYNLGSPGVYACNISEPLYKTSLDGSIGIGSPNPTSKLKINNVYYSSQSVTLSNCSNSDMVMDSCLAEIKTSSPDLAGKSLGRGFSKSLSSTRSREITKDVSIGAGAKISQALNADHYPLDSWKDTPDAVMTIYFVFQEKFNEIAAEGLRDLKGSSEGMLAGLVVG